MKIHFKYCKLKDLDEVVSSGGTNRHWMQMGRSQITPKSVADV